MPVAATTSKQLFKVEWYAPREVRAAILKTFANMTEENDNADMGKNVDLIGRWAEVDGKQGIAILGANSNEDVSAFMLNWATMCDIKVTPVLGDASFRKVLKTKDQFRN